MKKFSLLIAAGLISAAAFAGAPTWIEFSSKGPDKYADGSDVRDGEIYALVYIRGEFEGIKPDGTVVNPAKSKIICRAPVAKDGRCPQITYALEGTKEGGFQYEGGRFEVLLLDTRVQQFDAEGNPTDKVTVGLNGGSTVYSGWQSIASTGSSNVSIASAEAQTISAENIPVLPAEDAEGLKPVISGMTVFDGNVYITVANTRSTLKYEISGYKTLGDANPKAFCKGMQGAAKEGDTITLVYKDDPADRYTFFKVKVSGVNVK